MRTSPEPHGTHLSRAMTAIVLATSLLTAPTTALAGPGPCAAGMHTTPGSLAYAKTFTLLAHTGCAPGIPSGAATACYKATQSANPLANDFLAVWMSTALRTMDLTGGCSFMCVSGDCRVGNDGLPVELLQFGVE